jgi:hypothetical protein
MSVREQDNRVLYGMVQDKNLLRQYDLLLDCIAIGLEKGIEAFDKYTLWSLNAAAVANIAQFGGRYRKGPIYVGSHIPLTSTMCRTRWTAFSLWFMRTGR